MVSWLLPWLSSKSVRQLNRATVIQLEVVGLLTSMSVDTQVGLGTYPPPPLPPPPKEKFLKVRCYDIASETNLGPKRQPGDT